jgi:hypothetical protein
MAPKLVLCAVSGVFAGVAATVVAGQAGNAQPVGSAAGIQRSDEVARGRVSVYTGNPHYFAYDGKPVLLVGATHFGGWTPICTRSHDFRRDLQRLSDVMRKAGNPHVRRAGPSCALLSRRRGSASLAKAE